MSDKVKFIRDCVIRMMPKSDKADDCISYAEWLWDHLTVRGYGEKKEMPVKSKGQSHYEALSEEQRVWFDRFWQAFNYKSGKEGAAKEWLKLGNLSDNQYQQIIDAAKRAATTPLPQGITRKMAQGWLSDKRYEDEHYAISTQSIAKLSDEESFKQQLAGVQIIAIDCGTKKPTVTSILQQMKS